MNPSIPPSNGLATRQKRFEVPGGKAKGKREDTFYNLHPGLLDELRRTRPANAHPADAVFKFVPNVLTFHRYCKRAGVARYDAEGRQLDRHALRTTLGTHLALAGVLPQQSTDWAQTDRQRHPRLAGFGRCG